MTRHVKELDYATLSERLHRQAVRSRLPISGSLALTYRCNLSCQHCYLTSASDSDHLPRTRWLEIIDQVADAGCLWLLLTGGEPLLHPDFEELYLHAKKRGLLVSVFTNGTTVSDEAIRLFGEWPPYVVEVSLYGFSQTTFGQVTGVPEARDGCFDAVRRLAEANIPLRLKTMALRHNVHELPLLQRFADELGLPFRYDPVVNAALDGSPAPCASRLDPEQIVGVDVDDPARLDAWESFLSTRPELPARQSLFSCGGGETSFFIDPAGGLCLCAFDTPVHDLTRGSFETGWQGAVLERRRQALPDTHACNGCRDQTFCGVCPPVARMETGDELRVPHLLCQLGRARARKIRGAMVGR